MPFNRPSPASKLRKPDRQAVLRDYFEHYRRLAQVDQSALNPAKPARAPFENLLNEIGILLQGCAAKIAEEPGQVRDFLEKNALPGRLRELLPDEFRAYCLALNALKQWVAKEQAATDRYLLGGRAREECRAATTVCIVTGEDLIPEQIELHHPVRDGRPPIPLSKNGHSIIEKQVERVGSDPTSAKLVAVRKECNRSWAHLRRGCCDLLGQTVAHSTPKMGASARSFARKAHRATGMSFEQMIAWLDEHEL